MSVKIPEVVAEAAAAYRAKPNEETLRQYVQCVVWWYGVEHWERRRVGFDEIMGSAQAMTIIIFLADKLAGPKKKTGKPPVNRNAVSVFRGCPFNDFEGRWLVYQVDLIRSKPSHLSVIAACGRLKTRVEDGSTKRLLDYTKKHSAKMLAEHYKLAKERLEQHGLVSA
jgi:hypothetical protein